MQQTKAKTGMPEQNGRSLKTVVCVTDQLSCDRIIRSGKTLAGMTDTQLIVINISTPQRSNDPEAMEYLFRVSAEYGGEMNVIYSESISKALSTYIKENKVAYLVTGIPRENDTVIAGIWQKFTHIRFFTVQEGGELCEVTRTAMQQYGMKRA